MMQIPGKRKGTFLYVYQGYGYHRDPRHNDPEIYRCATRSTTGCTTTAEVSYENPIRINIAHNGVPHPPNPTRVEESRMIQKMLQLCRETTKLLKPIFDEVCRENLTVATNLDFRTLKPMLERERALNRPPVPASLKELAEVLISYEPTLSIFRGIVEAADGSVALIFASDIMLKALNTAKELYSDGTFKITPHRPRAMQLYTFHTRIMDTGVPLVYVLTSSRTTAMYRAIIERLMELAPDLQDSLEFVMGDYERAAMAAIRDCFPNASLHGCWFHYNQAVFRKWRQLGLHNAPNKILRWAMVLPLAPFTNFDEGVELLTRLADEIAEQHPAILLFTLYLRRQWVPLAKIVSVHGCPSRTDNLVESFHQAVKGKLSGLHPNIWIFLDRLCDLIADHEISLAKLTAGHRVRRLRPLKRALNDAGIKEAQENLAHGRFTLTEFLLRCSTLARNRYEATGDLQQTVQPNESAETDHLVDVEWMAVGEPTTTQQAGNVRRGRGQSTEGRGLRRAANLAGASGITAQPGTALTNDRGLRRGRGRSTGRGRARGRGRGRGRRQVSDSSDSEEESLTGATGPINETDPEVPVDPPAIDDRSAGYNWRDDYEPDDPVFRIPEDDFEVWRVIPDEVPFHPVLPIAPPTENLEPQLEIRSNCSLCKAAAVTHAFVPCGHRCSCAACILRLEEMEERQCPICRSPYDLAIFVRDA